VADCLAWVLLAFGDRPAEEPAAADEEILRVTGRRYALRRRPLPLDRGPG
jgi:hypothetical protein